MGALAIAGAAVAQLDHGSGHDMNIAMGHANKAGHEMKNHMGMSGHDLKGHASKAGHQMKGHAAKQAMKRKVMRLNQVMNKAGPQAATTATQGTEEEALAQQYTDK